MDKGCLASNRLYSQRKPLPKDVGYKKALLPVQVTDVGQEWPTDSKMDSPATNVRGSQDVTNTALQRCTTSAPGGASRFGPGVRAWDRTSHPTLNHVLVVRNLLSIQQRIWPLKTVRPFVVPKTGLDRDEFALFVTLGSLNVFETCLRPVSWSSPCLVLSHRMHPVSIPMANPGATPAAETPRDTPWRRNSKRSMPSSTCRLSRPSRWLLNVWSASCGSDFTPSTPSKTIAPLGSASFAGTEDRWTRSTKRTFGTTWNCWSMAARRRRSSASLCRHCEPAWTNSVCCVARLDWCPRESQSNCQS
ncbi:hypothetical protein RE6C_04757 [Rhodopirellula europaea 6C]|uniref:Uncharacterized protein n=1 Tax=Rhodopirellula europaea 6C TaxID=1263867 RepID=M2AC03_9BACT|nr:hypothetical protein RE6C_04757 [Rhodopirellula europaea 6C]